MPGYRERTYSEDAIDSALNSPQIRKVKEGITQMAEDLKRAETPVETTQTLDDDQSFQRVVAQSRSPQPRPRGPLAGQNQNRRVDQAADTVDRILHNLQQGRQTGQTPTEDLDVPNPREQGFVDDFEDGSEDGFEEEAPLPPPRPRPGQQRRPQTQQITNRDAATPEAKNNGYRPPNLSDVQALKLELAQQREEIEALRSGKRVPTDDPKTGKLRFARKPTIAHSNFQKVPLLSEHLFYDFSPDDMTACPVTIQAQFGISQAKAARNGEGDIPMLLDTLQSLVNPHIDVRWLTKPDFYYLLYWLRFNSYPAIPFNITWKSRYGNENKFAITQPRLQYLRAEPDLDELLRWKDMGLDYPRMRDWEILNCMDLDPEDREIYERAQYFQGDTPEEKVERMYAASPDALYEKDRMMAACNHGVFDTVDLADEHFDPVKWRDALLTNIPGILEDAERYKADDAMMALQIKAQADAYQAEADAITEALAKGERVEPNAERVALRFSPLAFFPFL